MLGGLAGCLATWHSGPAGAAAFPSPATSASITHTVAPGQSLADALRRAADGDEIYLLAGEHRAQAGVITQKRLTLRGIGGRPVLSADGAHAEGKATLVVREGDVLIDNIEFRGARVPDGNGAGIRFERGRLHVNRCAFFDNQMGLLTANFSGSELTVSDCEFGQAPERDATGTLPHLLYVGRIARLTLTGSAFSGGNDGHLVKSRARENHVRYNQLVDGILGRASYELEFPNGGIAYVVGNVIGQSETTRNTTLLAFGAEGDEGAAHEGREHALHVVNNTFFSHGMRPAVFVRVHDSKLMRPVEQRLANNLFIGLGVAGGRWSDLARGNFVASPTVLRDADVGDYMLHPMSALRGRGVAPGSARRADLQPRAAFTPPVGTRRVAAPDRWSPGAYQD